MIQLMPARILAMTEIRLMAGQMAPFPICIGCLAIFCVVQLVQKYIMLYTGNILLFHT